ncbi:MAG: DUF4143 domain-containing protein [bacterium]
MYRILASTIQEKSKYTKILLGARQTGKTTLLKNSFPDAVYINIEKSDYIDIFNSRDINKIKEALAKESGKDSYQTLILDEVQRLDNPGLAAKIIYDEIKNISLILSGSSSLEIASKISESLAGRKETYSLYPLTVGEYLAQTNKIKTLKPLVDIKSKNTSLSFFANLFFLMKYGLYPELLNIDTNDKKEKYLLELVDSAILKDVYYFGLVKNTKKIASLLKLLAYQIGQQINYSDLASRVGVARATVIDYIEILKQTYIIYTLPPFTKKRRDEIGKMEKIYFYDLGIRNALINDFSPVEYRVDYGNIFENFAINELIKLNNYYNWRYKFYYWRTKAGSEVDLILQKDEKISAIEIKTRKSAISKAFKDTYPDAKTINITLDNLLNFIL